MNAKFFIFILVALSLTGCWKAPETIKDVSDLRQNHVAYFNDQTRIRDLITAENQTRLDEDYNIIYFSVWHQREPFYAQTDAVSSDSRKFSVNLGFGEKIGRAHV